ncbi:Ribosomal rna large subunit methyltransferase h [Thalictrum thalictroides]|uniref:Ribosomal rna large subunit methyltransferase h n=1 Tax=Thalictrum thalictroides TaxID=46969 RepID=A0A7J6VJ79_THATH|nr:Ribosomal rna large subunit methyltransferase h [Thalictrum thalictroides]
MNPCSSSSSDLGRKCKYSGQSVRAIPIRIITVGKKRSKGVQLLVEEYNEKIMYYCSVDDIQIRSNPKNTSDVNAQIEGEDMVVMQHIRSEDWVVLLDEHGIDVGSVQMADLLGDAGITGASTLSFCIGGPYGHGKQLRKRANVTIKLSSMVLNHQIALVVLLEQLYRAWTILKGQKYHH